MSHLADEIHGISSTLEMLADFSQTGAVCHRLQADAGLVGEQCE